MYEAGKQHFQIREVSPNARQWARIPPPRSRVWGGLTGCYMPERNLGASAASALAPAASGASIGTSIFPGVGTAVGALVGAAAGLLGPKAHYSPWNFLYDDYPQHIYELQTQVVALQNAINRLTGDAQLPAPPMYSKTGGSQYQASMQAIVPQYVPGSEGKISSYDRTLNESGGAYEITVQKQLALIPQLQNTLQTLQARGVQPAPASVQSGSPTASPAGSYYSPAGTLLPPGYNPTYPTNYQSPSIMPQLQPGPSMVPSNISITTPGQMQAGMLPSFNLQDALPYILGGVGLFVILMTQGKQSSPSRKRK